MPPKPKNIKGPDYIYPNLGIDKKSVFYFSKNLDFSASSEEAAHDLLLVDGGRPALDRDEIGEFVGLPLNKAKKRVPAWLKLAQEPQSSTFSLHPPDYEDDEVHILGQNAVTRHQLKRWLEFRMYQASTRGYEEAKKARWVVFLDRMVHMTDLSQEHANFEHPRTKVEWVASVREKWQDENKYTTKRGEIVSFEDFLRSKKMERVRWGKAWPEITQEEWLETVRFLFKDKVESPHLGNFLDLSQGRKAYDGRHLAEFHQDIITAIGEHTDETPDLEEEALKKDPSEQDIWPTFVEYVGYECLYLDWLRRALEKAESKRWREANNGRPSRRTIITEKITLQEKIVKDWAIPEINKMKEEILAGELDPNPVKRKPRTRPLRTTPTFKVFTIKEPTAPPIVKPNLPGVEPTAPPIVKPNPPGVEPTTAPAQVGSRTSRRLVGQPPEFGILPETNRGKRKEAPTSTTTDKEAEPIGILKPNSTDEAWGTSRSRGRPPKRARISQEF